MYIFTHELFDDFILATEFTFLKIYDPSSYLFSHVGACVAPVCDYNCNLAVCSLKGYFNLVGEIQKIEKILKTMGFKAKIIGSKIVQVKGVMLLSQPNPGKYPPAEPLGLSLMA